MQVSVTFRHMDSTEALHDHASDRVSRVTKFLPQATSAHVILCVEKLSHKAEILIDAGGIHCRGEAHSDDMYRSIDAAAEKIERQVKRYLDKIHTYKPKHAASDLPFTHEVFALPVADETARNVVTTKQVMAKEMTVDDAVMQMDLIGNDFLVFQNVDSKLLSVLYRRQGGHFGLIEATTR
jgi:putative sigma-54 modulation protein